MDQSSTHFGGNKNLTDEQRRAIIELLLQTSHNKKLKRGILKEVAEKFSTNPKTISRIWQHAKSCMANDLPLYVSSRMRRQVGRKRIQIDFSKVSGIDLRKWTNIRSLSKAMDVKQTTLYKRLKEGELRRHTSAVKPYLTQQGKRARLQFCLSMLEPHSLNNDPIFKDMYNYVHIDEKWFFMSKETEKYYLLPSEMEPSRTCKSKRFITKVIFLVVVTRPRYDASRNQEFSGKIGIFPFVYKEPAKRKSKNRTAGIMETKSIPSITKEITRAFLIEHVLPAIRSKWPRGDGIETIYIQQDNGRPHICETDPEFLRAACIDGFDIRLSNQPPNSPDINILDLGFFNAIKSLQNQEAPTTIDELVHAVHKSFEQLSSESINFNFLSVQACMREVIKCLGENRYKLPHIGKKRMVRNGTLHVQLQCDRDVVENAIAHLQNATD